jgi:predicted cupin superfamily sugar epimerase
MLFMGAVMITAEKIKSLLNLTPHPEEGGYFVETYRSQYHIPKDALPEGYKDERLFATAIYYLLTPDTFSAMHRLPTDEIFHFYLGDPVEMLQLLPDGSGNIITLGSDIIQGMHLQITVKKGIWQGSRLLPGGRFALLGTTMSPGFERADYESGKRDVLIKSYPRFRDLISALTRC